MSAYMTWPFSSGSAQPLKSSPKAANTLSLTGTMINSSSLEVCVINMNLPKATCKPVQKQKRDTGMHVCIGCHLLQVILRQLGTQQHKKSFKWHAVHVHTARSEEHSAYCLMCQICTCLQTQSTVDAVIRHCQCLIMHAHPWVFHLIKSNACRPRVLSMQ